VFVGGRHPFPYVVRRISCGRHSAIALAHGTPRCTALRRSSRATRCRDWGVLRLSRGAHAACTRSRGRVGLVPPRHRYRAALVRQPVLLRNQPTRSRRVARRCAACAVLQRIARRRAVLQRVARRCSGLQRIARYSRGAATNRNIIARCCKTHCKIFARCCNALQDNRAGLQRIAPVGRRSAAMRTDWWTRTAS
jgi:hypothetical protein